METQFEAPREKVKKIPQIYPEDLLLTPPCQLADRRWWVMYTKPRHEKALARRLLAMSVPFYLPLVGRRAVCRGRHFTSQVPLFPGYLFLFATEDERVRSLTTNRILRNLPVVDEKALRQELGQLRQLIESGEPLTVESRLTPGRLVRVRHGALAGLEGTVLARQGHARLVIRVTFLQQGASVIIQDYMVEPID